MSGRSLADAISIFDDEVEDFTAYAQDEVDVQIYDSEYVSDDDDDAIGDENGFSWVDSTPPAFVPPLQEFEIPDFLIEGAKIVPNSVVELKDHSGRSSDHRISGDFFLIRSIIENVETGEVVLRGYRMRRCTYLQPLFDGKFNDLFLLLEVTENDSRPPFEQGLQDLPPDEVIQLRKCIFTNLTHENMSLRSSRLYVPNRLRKREEIKEWLFENGPLFCRWVHIVELHRSGSSYGGEARRIYKREVTTFSPSSKYESIPEPAKPTTLSDRGRRHKRSRSVQEMSPSKHAHFSHQKSRVFTFADGFCGCGGVSQGARQAGWKIEWGLEKDPTAMAAYRINFPNARHLEMDAHDFPGIVQRSVHKVDHVHMSCPCCYWSENHTVEGRNDEANMLTIYTVQPWLKKLKPRTFSLEQAPGLIKLAKHKMYFRQLINGILSENYNVRYKVQDQAWFGIGQHRRRLVLIGAKLGTPLPPFPAPVHGPSGSGLKRWVTIGDSLRVLEREHLSFHNDPYHQPQKENRVNKAPIDPHVNLAKCVTTSGGDNVHHSGRRNNTPRELAAYQTFPPNFCFTGSVTNAKKQCGNAWPVKANEAYFLMWAAHCEAFDNDLIKPEDEVYDLYEFLKSKDIHIPRAPIIDLDRSDSLRRDNEPSYIYLHRIKETVKPRIPLQLWSRHQELDPLPQRRRRNA
ncbi:S-adenosyl-L-methionine-dependent methyltransferase [Phaeosphaeriaceae sp. PMI808]|nr:S-adenosyl-L-methionine-dependent methyltransferase [Phaeosphaeriaceae sp. PMI808]